MMITIVIMIINMMIIILMINIMIMTIVMIVLIVIIIVVIILTLVRIVIIVMIVIEKRREADNGTSSETTDAGQVSVRSIRSRPGLVFCSRYCFDRQGPKPMLDRASCYVNVAVSIGSITFRFRSEPPFGD